MSRGRRGGRLALMNTHLIEMQNYLQDLTAEQAPEDEILAAHHAYVGAAVTEIATLRAELGGPQEG
jgi:hypothetical protein